MLGKVVEAGDLVEDRVFGCDPVVSPRQEASGEEWFSFNELGRVT